MQELRELLTFVTVGYNSAAVLPSHIESYRRSASEAIPRWLVVDNASTDGTADLLEGYAQVELLQNADNLGFGAACNRGIAAATTRYVLVLNPDTELSESAVRDLLLELQQRGAAIAGPALEPESDPQTVEVNWLIGAVLLLDTTLMNPVGYFDEQFFLYEEDKDICKCAKDAGLKVIHCRSVNIPHVGGGSTERSKAVNEFIHFHRGRSFVLYARKHGLGQAEVDRFVADNRRRCLVAMATFGIKRYRRARAKLIGAASVQTGPASPSV